MNDLIDAILASHRQDDNPYFQALEDGSFAQDDFLETQIQFYFAPVGAVRHAPRDRGAPVCERDVARRGESWPNGA